MEANIIYLPLLLSIVGLVYMLIKASWVKKQDAGSERMVEISTAIKEGALAIGATKSQAVFHHVVPLALPGTLTGTIIGLAQALGETAPLIMIGMVAFIPNIPTGITEPSASLPVQIFLWVESAERGFQEKSAAAIMVILLFLFMMNALAVYLRNKFEKKW